VVQDLRLHFPTKTAAAVRCVFACTWLPIIHPIVQPHPQPLQSNLSLVNELHELVLDREANLPHAHPEAGEVSQVVLSTAQKRFELGEGQVGRVHRPRAKNARDASLAGGPKHERGMYHA
jgi:hypothetical protein